MSSMAAATIHRVHPAATPAIGRISVTGHIPAGGHTPREGESFRVLGSYAVVYVLSGQARYTDATGFAANVAAGDMMLILPEMPHSYGPVTGQTWNQLFIVFEGPVFDLWRQHQMLDAAQPVRHLEPIDHWAKRFHDIVHATRRDTPGSVLQDVCQLQLLLADAFNQPDSRTCPTSEEEHWLAHAVALVETDLHQRTDLHSIATELGMSYDGFRKRFRRLTGVAPARYRNLRVIDRTCELMMGTKLTDREIAAKLGFCNEFHFSNRFRQFTGRSPRQFRATIPHHQNP